MSDVRVCDQCGGAVTRDGYSIDDCRASHTLERIGQALSDKGCDCDCDHYVDEHREDCVRCLGCKVSMILSEHAEATRAEKAKGAGHG